MKHEYSAGIVTYSIPVGSKNVEYLLLQYEAGHWDFPKGIIEQGESEPEAALRELKEEAGITADIDTDFTQSISYMFKNKQGELVSKKVTFYVGRTHERDITLSFEHIGYKWLTFNEALKQLTYTNAKQLLTVAHRYIDQKKMP